MKRFTTLFIFLLLLVSSQPAAAQVTISPTAVFLDRNTNVGTMNVSNPADETVEVRLSFEFAYPATRNDGQVYLNYEDEETEDRFSLEPHLRAFPTTFTLEPGERQSIRLIGRVPQNSDPGTYWTRMRVSSNQLTPPVGELAEGEVAARVAFQIDQVTAVFLHHRDVETRLSIHESRADVADGRLVILTDVERSGNAPFLGSVNTRVLNSNGDEVTSRQSSTSVYFRNNQRVEFDASDWEPGEYTIETTFRSSRRDISSRNLVEIPDVSERTTVTIE